MQQRRIASLTRSYIAIANKQAEYMAIRTAIAT